METDILKHFIGKDVEVLVAGVWIEGHMAPIVKGVVTLTPTEETAPFYGATALKSESIQAIRQVKRSNAKLPEPIPEVNSPVVRSSLDQVTPGQRFKRNQ